MVFSVNMEKAAERHYLAAEILHDTAKLHCVAGYLYGIAAECAIKHIMRQTGITALLPHGKDRGNPMYAHFPSLKVLLRNKINGRKAQVLQPVIADDFMLDWDISMRYTETRKISKKRVDRWKKQAFSIIKTMRGQ